MSENLRHFEVTDPFGQTWQVEFRWQQNAISIRHADAVDCKYYLTSGAQRRELVVSLPHAALTAEAARCGRQLTDAWLMRLAARHLAESIAAWTDVEKPIITLSPAEIARHAAAIGQADADARQAALDAH